MAVPDHILVGWDPEEDSPLLLKDEFTTPQIQAALILSRGNALSAYHMLQQNKNNIEEYLSDKMWERHRQPWIDMEPDADEEYQREMYGGNVMYMKGDSFLEQQITWDMKNFNYWDYQ